MIGIVSEEKFAQDRTTGLYDFNIQQGGQAMDTY